MLILMDDTIRPFIGCVLLMGSIGRADNSAVIEPESAYQASTCEPSGGRGAAASESSVEQSLPRIDESAAVAGWEPKRSDKAAKHKRDQSLLLLVPRFEPPWVLWRLRGLVFQPRLGWSGGQRRALTRTLPAGCGRSGCGGGAR